MITNRQTLDEKYNIDQLRIIVRMNRILNGDIVTKKNKVELLDLIENFENSNNKAVIIPDSINNKPADKPAPQTAPEPKETKPEPAPKIEELVTVEEIEQKNPEVKHNKNGNGHHNGEDVQKQFFNLLNQIVTPKNADIDLNVIDNLISKRIKETSVKTIEVITPEKKIINVGKQHKLFEKLLIIAKRKKLNVWLYGEAGSGKTHTIEAIAKALELNFHAISVTQQTTKSDLLGFIDANGNYHESEFYKAYKNGGLFLLDEVDNGNANVLNVLNSATSNGVCFFPTGEVKKHENFLIFAAANTIGDGNNRQYIGRNALDGALKNRFIYIEYQTDWDLVREIQISQYGDGDQFKRLFDKILKIRETLYAQNDNKTLITPRTIFQASELLDAGFSQKEILEMTVIKGADYTTAEKIRRIV